MNLNQHATNQAISYCLRDIADLKILQSDWPRAFWHISHKPDFSRTWDFCRNIAKTLFWSIVNLPLPPLKKKKKKKNPVLLHTTSYEFPTTSQNLEKTKDPISKKPAGWSD